VHGPGLGDLLKIWGFPFNIYTMAEASDFRFGTQLGFAKAHHEITPIGKRGHGLGLEKLPRPVTRSHAVEKWARPWSRGAPQNLGFPFNISATTESSDFKIGRQVVFAKGHHKITPREKVGVAMG